MAGSHITAIVIAIVFGAAGVYDVSMALAYGYEATLTAVVREYSSRWSVIPFLAGVLAGHLFAP